MGKWLEKFSAVRPETRTDKADRVAVLPSVSALSGPDGAGSTPQTLFPAAHEPTPPLAPGWLVVYRNRQGGLCGGCEDRPHGTVQASHWRGGAWTVHLTDGQRLPLGTIRAVGKTDGEGRLLAAWTVREHGYDGMRGA